MSIEEFFFNGDGAVDVGKMEEKNIVSARVLERRAKMIFGCCTANGARKGGQNGENRAWSITQAKGTFREVEEAL